MGVDLVYMCITNINEFLITSYIQKLMVFLKLVFLKFMDVLISGSTKMEVQV